MTEQETIANLAEALRISEARVRDAEAKIAGQDTTIACLRSFLAGVGINSEQVETGFWMANAAKIISVSIDQESPNLDHMTADVRGSVVMAAQNLMSAGAAERATRAHP